MKLNYKYLIVGYLSLLSMELIAQADTLNKLNAAGKKNGYWKICYNEHFELVQDTAKAKYCDYEYFINGDVFREIVEKKHQSEMKIKYIPKDAVKDVKVLNGEVLYYDKYNNLAYKDEFLNGVITKMHTYSYFLDSQKKYVLYYEELVDFTRPYNTSGNSYYYEKRNYKILKDKWDVKKGYVIFMSRNKQKTIKL